MSANTKFSRLMEPGQIGKIKTKNRFIKTANGTSYVIHESGYVGERGFSLL